MHLHSRRREGCTAHAKSYPEADLAVATGTAGRLSSPNQLEDLVSLISPSLKPSLAVQFRRCK